MLGRRHHKIRSVLAGSAVALLVVPVAQARIAEESGFAGSRGTSDSAVYRQSPGVPVAQQGAKDANAHHYVNHGGMWVKVLTPTRPDDMPLRFSPNGNPSFVSTADVPQAPQVVAAPSSGFSWSDAGIGAGAAIGLMLLTLGLALSLRQGSRGKLTGA